MYLIGPGLQVLHMSVLLIGHPAGLSHCLEQAANVTCRWARALPQLASYCTLIRHTAHKTCSAHLLQAPDLLLELRDAVEVPPDETRVLNRCRTLDSAVLRCATHRIHLGQSVLLASGVRPHGYASLLQLPSGPVGVHTGSKQLLLRSLQLLAGRLLQA